MLRIFWGMILGSMTTMVLLGGASAADQVIANSQALYLDHLNRLDTPTTLTPPHPAVLDPTLWWR